MKGRIFLKRVDINVFHKVITLAISNVIPVLLNLIDFAMMACIVYPRDRQNSNGV